MVLDFHDHAENKCWTQLNFDDITMFKNSFRFDSKYLFQIVIKLLWQIILLFMITYIIWHYYF